MELLLEVIGLTMDAQTGSIEMQQIAMLDKLLCLQDAERALIGAMMLMCDPATRMALGAVQAAMQEMTLRYQHSAREPN